MTSKEADLAAIKARVELNYAVASHPMFAGNPIVVAALANAKANDAAFFAAVVEADAARGLRVWSAYRHLRQASAASDKAHATLRAAVESAEAEYNAGRWETISRDVAHSDHAGLAKALDAALKLPGSSEC
jgi:multidrug resistance efflux pump